MLRGRNKAQRGFTLIELMTVVSIVAIVTAIAIPALRSSRKRGNETNTIAALRTMTGMQEVARVRRGTYVQISDLVGLGLIDETFLSDPRHGYDLSDVAAPDPATYSIDAQPTVPGQTGDRFFFVDESGIIRESDSGVADSSSNPLGQ